ncbi:hypothetical protein VE03_02869 [Pseudogymnoascus sp. 23342-1-I1]|nr:hypothetical protein VE03_02869 [Pseudogymnoascus sp. 23342-1-I1]
MDDHPSTPTHFHPPTPASTLLSQLRKTQTDPSTGLKLERLRTGVGDIDSHLLGGGIQRGCIVGISSGYGGGSGRGGYASTGEEAAGDTGRLMALHMLARTLLERPGALASVVDATGSFPLVGLAGVVRWWAERGVGSGAGGGKGGGVEERVNSVLERVGITRVFDVEGLWEVLGEVGGGNGGVEGGGGAEGGDAKGVVVGKGGMAGDREDEEGGSDGQTEGVDLNAGAREIMDSEDDDDDDDLTTQRPPNQGPQPPTKGPISNPHNHRAPAPAIPSRTTPTTEIILVDNLTTLITTLFSRTSTPAAHALLTQLSRTLTTLTRSSSLTIFLLNTLVKKSAKAAGNNAQRERERQHSVFGGMTAVPSLGVVFDGFVDLHLMCHALPRGREDAEGVYGGERPDEEDGDSGTAVGERGGGRNGGERGGGGGVIRFANVVEVLKDECPQLDRWEGVSGDERPGRAVNREQRWATFKVVEGVGLGNEEFGGGGDEPRY